MLNEKQSALLETWKDVPIGTDVYFRPRAESPDEIRTKTASAPDDNRGTCCTIHLEGVQGAAMLEFVRLA